jgi:hypothetical protein
LALELDTKILILLGTCRSCLFTSKADIGKVVLKGSLGKEVTPIFEIIRAKCTAMGHLV